MNVEDLFAVPSVFSRSICTRVRVPSTACMVICHLVKYTGTHDNRYKRADRQTDGRKAAMCEVRVRKVCGFSCVNSTRVARHSESTLSHTGCERRCEV